MANVQTRSFQNTLKLTTTPKSAICPIPEFQNVANASSATVKLVNDQSINGRFKHVAVKVNMKCSSCNKVIQETDRGNTGKHCHRWRP